MMIQLNQVGLHTFLRGMLVWKVASLYLAISQMEISRKYMCFLCVLDRVLVGICVPSCGAHDSECIQSVTVL